MEGFVWLLLKMAGLLALASAAFFALGWRIRGKQAALASEAVRNEIEQLRASIRAAVAEKDAAMRESRETNEQLRASAQEVARLMEEQKRLRAEPAVPPEPAPPAKTKAKPRTRRKKSEI